MTPFASTADSQAALATVHESLSKVRDALRDCISPQVAPPAPKLSSPIKKHSQKVLTHAVMAKVAHDAIIRSVDIARRNSQADIALLQTSRQRHASLRYERALLERQIEAEREIKAPSVDKLAIKLPAPPPKNASDEEALDAHMKTLKALRDELERRKRVHDQVDDVVKQTKRKREELANMKDGFRALPRAVATLRNAIEPVRKMLKVGEELAASPPELAQIRLLPVPLYVLTREAFAFRAIFPNMLNISLLEEQSKLETVYRAHPRYVRMDVRGKEDVGTDMCLQVVFKFHPELQVVTVTSRVAKGVDVSTEMDGKLLQLLFPYDVGNNSPNPCNAHLEGGRFSFDASKAGGARPFVWANLLCALPCLERFDMVNEVVGAGWPAKAAGHEEHIRFKETVFALQKRLSMEIALRKQLDALKSKRMPVKAEELGFSAEPEARLESFAESRSRNWESKRALGGDNANIVFREVWGMRVRHRELTVACDIGVAPNYPTGTPCFRLRVEDENSDVTEADLLELEQKVNMHMMEGEMENKKELLLTGQILMLLEGVDTLGGQKSGSARIRRRHSKEKIPASLARLLT